MTLLYRKVIKCYYMYMYLPARTLRPGYVFVSSFDFVMLVRGFNVPQLYTGLLVQMYHHCA